MNKGNRPKFIKGPDIFIKTLIKLSSKIGKDKIHVVLTSPHADILKKLKQNKIYTYFYPIEKEEITFLFNCLDYYLITSRDEGGPRGIFEAMACGEKCYYNKCRTCS